MKTKPFAVDVETLKCLVNWMTGLKYKDVTAVVVKLGDISYQGVRYTSILEYTKEMDACRRGEKKPGDTYQREFFYLLAERPKARRVCYPFNGQEWYIASYSDERCLTEPHKQYHPFGYSFMLGCWDIPNEKIDTYEPKPYTRIPMNVETVNF